jgi:hypothetical protein
VSPLSLLTFFAAAKKVSAAPHRGDANRPKTKQGKANTARKGQHSKKRPKQQEKTKTARKDQNSKKQQHQNETRRKQNNPPLQHSYDVPFDTNPSIPRITPNPSTA